MNVFAAGQSAFLRNWDYAYDYSITPATSKLKKSQVGVASLPTFAGQTPPGFANIGGWNLYINPHSKHIAADVTFIKWMTSQAAQTTLGTQFSEIPTVQSVRSSAAVQKVNPVLAIVGNTRLIPRPAQTPQYAKVSQALYTNLNSMLSGSASPSAALSAASSQINSALSSSGL